jgi:hypothetical protein
VPKIIIEYTIPPGSDRASVAQFVSDALESWGGGFHPEDPLFHSLRGHMTKLIVSNKDFTELLTKKEDE